jgi:hypothetical protein
MISRILALFRPCRVSLQRYDDRRTAELRSRYASTLCAQRRRLREIRHSRFVRVRYWHDPSFIPAHLEAPLPAMLRRQAI